MGKGIAEPITVILCPKAFKTLVISCSGNVGDCSLYGDDKESKVAARIALDIYGEVH